MLHPKFLIAGKIDVLQVKLDNLKFSVRMHFRL